jgi:CHASE2 domain-containing sensor protein
VADVVDRVGKAAPAVIGLDIFLSEPRSADEDAAMQRALSSAGNVVIASAGGNWAASGRAAAVHVLPA